MDHSLCIAGGEITLAPLATRVTKTPREEWLWSLQPQQSRMVHSQQISQCRQIPSSNEISSLSPAGKIDKIIQGVLCDRHCAQHPT